ncbi:MAG: hypothetical protein QOF00_1646 [Pseudonocardiales bacterium]|jgi:hypothetical protein|nr:hypothetical protein [Pseudonocardiales bacterium]
MVVEVVLVLGRDRGRVVLVGDEDRVEEFAANAADESFGGRVRSWAGTGVLITSTPAAASTASTWRWTSRPGPGWGTGTACRRLRAPSRGCVLAGCNWSGRKPVVACRKKSGPGSCQEARQHTGGSVWGRVGSGRVEAQRQRPFQMGATEHALTAIRPRPATGEPAARRLEFKRCSLLSGNRGALSGPTAPPADACRAARPSTVLIQEMRSLPSRYGTSVFDDAGLDLSKLGA